MLVGWVVFKRLWDSFFWRNSDTELFYGTRSLCFGLNQLAFSNPCAEALANEYIISLDSAVQVLSIC